MIIVNETLELKLKNLPDSPGVYLFKNEQGKIIYIGKAKNLRNRVRSYFQESHHPDPKTAVLVAQIRDLELIATHNEIESLILEANLVHEYKPRYNIRLKDDKHFPYIKVTNEPFPRVMVVRRLQKDGARYFGPYTNIKGIYRTLQFLERLFQIRNCHLVIPNPTDKPYKVCLDYHIKRCGGPCEGLISTEEYRHNVDSLVMMLSGKSKELVRQLTERMMQASEQMRFEEAVTLRDQIEQIKNMMMRQSVDVGEIVDRDVIGVARESGATVAVVMQIREGVLIGRQEFFVESDPVDTNDIVLQTFLTQYYNHQPNLPEEIVIPIEIPEQKLLERWLKQAKGDGDIKVCAPKIGDQKRMLDLAGKNARLLLDEKLIQRRFMSERLSKMVVSLKDELKLPKSPKTMVCFDISNTGAMDAVGSAAYFDNGRPKKTEYRHFKIKGVAGQDDFKMMREIVGRYFFHIREEKLQPPDLVIVDGGKGQLSNALAELQSLGFSDQPIISLAKRLEEVFVPGLSDPITIPRSSPALLLLKRIRDEAHRFAIEYNRKVRTKRTIMSALDEIPGIGPARRDLLLTTFGSVERIRQLTPDELAQVKGINVKLAETILQRLAAVIATPNPS